MERIPAELAQLEKGPPGEEPGPRGAERPEPERGALAQVYMGLGEVLGPAACRFDTARLYRSYCLQGGKELMMPYRILDEYSLVIFIGNQVQSLQKNNAV